MQGYHNIMSFIIYALPRSRTAWVSHYLNYPLARPTQGVGHDLAVQMGSVEAFMDLYNKEGMFGSVEIGAVMAWRIIRKELPHLKTVVIRRPLIEVFNSFAKAGFEVNIGELGELEAMLDSVAEEEGVYSIKSSDLDAPVVCKWLFEYCLELEFDFDWWVYMQNINIQMDLHEIYGMKEDKREGEGAQRVITYKELLDQRRTAFRNDIIERMKSVSVSGLH